MAENGKAIQVLTLNTLAFTICFMCWMMNGVLITFLVENRVFDWTTSQMGWLIGIPVLSGAVTRLPVGILTDKYGGRIVYGILMLLSAVFIYLVSMANSYATFMLLGLGFGLTGASFAVGIAYTSVWFSKEHQGFALGVFGAGKAGAAITSIGAPHLLNWFTENGANLDGWRMLPKAYAASLVVMAIVFLLFTTTKLSAGGQHKTLADRLAPLRVVRVWRFGLYYFLVFGGFVALAQWLIPYYVNAYGMTVVMAGFMASIFSLPSGVIRALGGWMSDHFGARTVMQWILGACLVSSALLVVPRMDIWSPGSGVMARSAGVVQEVGEDFVLVRGLQGDVRYEIEAGSMALTLQEPQEEGVVIFPRSVSWQEPAVEVGDSVTKKQLLARGVTHIFFQANVWVFTFFVFVIGIAMGIGKAAVYKHIPDYFPDDVAVVGGMVGVLGGLGGFFLPILFGYVLESTGLWTTCWMFFAALSLACILWMNRVVRKLLREHAPQVAHHIDTEHTGVLGGRS